MYERKNIRSLRHFLRLESDIELVYEDKMNILSTSSDITSDDVNDLTCGQ